MRKDDYDPWDVYSQIDKERILSGDLREVKKQNEKRQNALSLPRQQQGEEVENVQIGSQSKSRPSSDHGKKKRKKGVVKKGKKRNLSPEERKRRSERMKEMVKKRKANGNNDKK